MRCIPALSRADPYIITIITHKDKVHCLNIHISTKEKRQWQSVQKICLQCEQKCKTFLQNSLESRTLLPLTSRAPPCTFFTPIIFRGSRSSSIITASTTILEKKSFCPAISLEFRAVAAHFSNKLLCSLWWQQRTNAHLCDIYMITRDCNT